DAAHDRFAQDADGRAASAAAATIIRTLLTILTIAARIPSGKKVPNVSGGRSHVRSAVPACSIARYPLWRRLTLSCASDRASDAFTVATSSSEILSRSRAAARWRASSALA